MTITYTKYHTSWAATDLLSAGAFNHIETQYDAAKADADLHTHDTVHYTKTLSDATFFTTTFYTGFDADKLDGSHFSDILATQLPIGAIMIWSGTDANVPTGWAVCNGGSGTVDLRDRFIVGAGSTYAQDATGGPATWNGTITPTGSVTVGNHTLTTTELPAHSHGYSEQYPVMNGGSGSLYLYSSIKTVSTTGRTAGNQASGGGSHGHTGSSIAFGTVVPRPLYYALYYIQKIS